MNTKKIIGIGVVGVIVIGGAVASYVLMNNTSVSNSTQNTQSVTETGSTKTGVTEGAFAPQPKPDTPTPSGTSTYTLADVATHNTQTDCWTVVNGNVYNLTSYVPKHPGGIYTIIKLCGVDGTAAFTMKHGGQIRPEAMLKTLLVGTLAS